MFKDSNAIVFILGAGLAGTTGCCLTMSDCAALNGDWQKLRGAKMAGDRRRFEKIVAIAMDPGAFEDEAIAALHKAREFIKQDPTLKEPDINPPQVEKPKSSYQARITNVHDSWLTILMGNLSEEAYGLGLRSKIACDFSQTPTAVEVRCDGEGAAFKKFEEHVDWVIEYINKKVAEK